MKVRQSYIAELWSSLTKMPNLSKLLISACDMDEILNLDMLEALPNLKALWMAGQLFPTYKIETIENSKSIASKHGFV
jgi:disease resistance protein RPM1